MKGKAIIPLVLGLCVGLIAVKFGVDAIRKAQASNTGQPMITVVRAKQDIKAFEKIPAEAVEVVETADNLFAPANERIASLEEVIGRVTNKSVPRYAPVLKSMLAPEGTRAGMVGRIPPGYRAVSVKIDEVTGVAFQMQPGDWVDVIVVMDVDTGERGKKETIAEVILQHVQVVAIGRGTDSTAEARGSGVKPAKSATLLVPEEEAPKLHLAATRGKITLAMRGEDDQAREDPAFFHSGDLFSGLRGKSPSETPDFDALLRAALAAQGQQNPVEPEATPELPHGVMVFHGSTGGKLSVAIERITFEHNRSPNILHVAQGPASRGSGAVATLNQRPRSPFARTRKQASREPNRAGTKKAGDNPNAGQ